MRAMLVAMACLSLASFAAYFVVAQPVAEPSPRELNKVAPWLRKHPGDWLAASSVIDRALDSLSPSRLLLWRTAYGHALMMAPYRQAPHLAFLHSGLGHWYELGDSDRRTVLAEATPLLRDPLTFSTVLRGFWEATGDFDLVRRANPGTQTALANLMQIAVTNGLYSDYRYCRQAYQRRRVQDFLVQRKTMETPEIAAAVPASPDVDDQPVLVAALDEWHRRPLDADPVRSIDGLIDYAIRHGLQPLDGIDYIVTHPAAADPTRARLALYLGRPERAADIQFISNEASPAAWREYEVERARFEMKRGDRKTAEQHLASAARAGLEPEVLAAAVAIEGSQGAQADLLAHFSTLSSWKGLCGPDVCGSARAQWYTSGPSRADLTLIQVQSDEDKPYVEIYADDARVAEGPVGERTTFTIAVPGSGVHRIEVRVVNPMTRNLIQRRVRIVSS
jgi:hypothetical protein